MRIGLILIAEICKHRNAVETSIDNRAVYKCPDCGSMFPCIGDTDLWADGIAIAIQKVEQLL